MQFYSPKLTDFFRKEMLPSKPRLRLVKMDKTMHPVSISKRAMAMVAISVLAGMIFYYWR